MLQGIHIAAFFFVAGYGNINFASIGAVFGHGRSVNRHFYLAGNLRRRQPESHSPLAVDPDLYFRIAILQGGAHIARSRNLFHNVHHLFGERPQRIQIITPDVEGDSASAAH